MLEVMSWLTEGTYECRGYAKGYRWWVNTTTIQETLRTRINWTRRLTHFTGAKRARLTRCHQTYYIVPSTLDKFYSFATSQFPAIEHQVMQKGLVAPSLRSRKCRRGSIFARAPEELCKPAAGMALQPDYMST